MSAPRATVVVPTKDRRELLGALLRSLAEQDVSARPLEVVVVDDGSEQHPAEAGDGELGDGVTLRVLRHASPRGPAAARNTGWRAASAPLVAFTDDDCQAAPDWLSRLLAAWHGAPERFVQGRTEVLPAHRSRLGPLARTQQVHGPGYFETCNIAYPRTLLEHLGGFDERFPRACGEDVDLGLRAEKAGARLAFDPRALTYHVVHEASLISICRHTFRWTDAVRLLSIHPELRARLFSRLFWKRTHPPLLLALAGVAWAARRRSIVPGVVASLPYLAHYRRRYSSSSRPWSSLARRLPAHLVIDACEVATMMVGSVRHRTLML